MRKTPYFSALVYLYTSAEMQSVYFRTGVKDVLTLLVNAWRSLSNALGVGFTRGISLILLGFTHRAQSRCSECFGINQQSAQPITAVLQPVQVRSQSPPKGAV